MNWKNVITYWKLLKRLSMKLQNYLPSIMVDIKFSYRRMIMKYYKIIYSSFQQGYWIYIIVNFSNFYLFFFVNLLWIFLNILSEDSNKQVNHTFILNVKSCLIVQNTTPHKELLYLMWYSNKKFENLKVYRLKQHPCWDKIKYSKDLNVFNH